MSKSNSWSRPKVVDWISKPWGGRGTWLIYLNATWFLRSGRATVYEIKQVKLVPVAGEKWVKDIRPGAFLCLKGRTKNLGTSASIS